MPVDTGRSSVAINAGVLALALAPAPARAELPAPVQAMLSAAIASGSDADVDTIGRYAKRVSPADAAVVDRQIADYRAARAAKVQYALKHERVLQGWHGEGQLGYTQTGGNSNTTGITAGVNLVKEGWHWRYRLRALETYQKDDGITTGNSLLVAFEPNYKINQRLYLFGLAQFERNRFDDLEGRETLGGGVGYMLIASPRVTLDIKGGPTWRNAHYFGEPDERTLDEYAAVDGIWRISRKLMFTENAYALHDIDHTTLNSLTALTVKLSSKLSVRLSYQYNLDNNPPPGFKSYDTTTRTALVYGF